MRSRTIVAALIGISGCTGVTASLTDRPCAAGECIDGYLCSPIDDVCVEAAALDCDGDGPCPSTTEAGDPCYGEGLWMPCTDEAVDCASGCRACQEDSTWSTCVDPACGVVCAVETPACVDGACVCTETSCTAPAVCSAGVCESRPCGDGVRGVDEACDGADVGSATCAGLGFFGGSLGCTADCELDPSACHDCGNGIADSGEACDGADLASASCVSLLFDSGSLACGADCLFDTSGCVGCGDGVRNGAEACDGADLDGATCVTRGFDSGTLVCGGTCIFDEAGCGICGNGGVDGDEACDGAELGGATCVDFGFAFGILSCNPDCTLDASGCTNCGNGAIDAGETCDGADLGAADQCADHGLVSGTVACQLDCSAYDLSGCSGCGNGTIEAAEICDGDELGGQGCSDHGFDFGSLACLPDCTAHDLTGCHNCGNGSIDSGEDCDGSPAETCVDNFCSDGSVTCTASCLQDISGCSVCLPVTTGLQLWYDSAATGTITQSSGNVSEWRNRVGSEHATSASNYRPVYGSATINGRNALTFAGDDRMVMGDLGALFPTAATLFVVARHNSSYAGTIAEAGSYNLFTARDTDTWWRWHATGAAFPGIFRSTRIESYTGNVPLSGTRVYAVESSASRWEMWIDGVSQGEAAADYDAGNDFRIGGPDDTQTNKYFEGEMGEILVYDRALSDAERQSVIDYLWLKWKACGDDADCGGGQFCSLGWCAPLLHWPFEGANLVQVDASGNGNDGDVGGGAAFISAGQVGGAYSFDGVDDFVATDAASPLGFGTGDFTVAAWFRTSSAGADIVVVSAPLSGSAGPGILLSVNPTGDPGAVSFHHNGAAANPTLIASGAYNDGGWHHVAAVRDGVERRLYVDGGWIATVGPAGSLGPTVDVWVARLSGAVDVGWFPGDIDEVLIVGHALSGPEIEVLASP